VSLRPRVPLRLSRVALVPVAPVVAVQAWRLKRYTPRLADAAAPWSGTEPGPDPIRLLVLGDSTAAGVGVASQADALPGNLARDIAAHTGRGVGWTAIGRNGATSGEVITEFVDEATASEYDIVFLSVGANDSLTIRSRAAFGRDIRTLLSRLRAANPSALILMSSLPAFSRFVLLPNPLRFNLYLHSRSLESVARAAVATMPGVHMAPPPPPYTEGFFADDLFHPSAVGYRDWSRFAVDDAVARGLL
jgi:lysophospholipase L1-like esterase